MTKKEKLIFILILLLGFLLRSFNLNWDQSQHLHPDERFLTMVVGKINWPHSITEYLNPHLSPLNPYNNNYGFFVYGTLPMKIVKAGTEFIKFEKFDYNNIVLVGRLISALFETGILILVFLITREIFKSKEKGHQVALWATFFYAISVLPIQLAHFFAVETPMVFFITLAFYLLFRFIGNLETPRTVTRQRSQLLRGEFIYPALIGVSTGLALACKVTAFLGVGIIILGFGAKFFIKKRNKNTSEVKLKNIILSILIFLFSSYFFLRIGDPRIFSSGNFLDLSPNQQFINNLKELASSNNPQSPPPPGVQWINTKPIIFPLKNMILWGWGLPLGIIVVVSVFYQGSQLLKKALSPNLSLILIFILATFFYQGVQFAKAMRYFYPIYPFLAVLSGIFFFQLINKIKKRVSSKLILNFLLLIFYSSILLYPFSFLSIYTHSHSRVAASHWIYENIPPGSFLAGEHWDDWLPVSIKDKSAGLYKGEQLPLYGQDSKVKWEKINQVLEETDYIVLSSNRLWGSIPKVPEKYPQTAVYYRKLFNEELGFVKTAEFTSYPCFPPIGKPLFCFPDQSADESFTVYDHPKVIIFKKN